jgi:hypothetical protein
MASNIKVIWEDGALRLLNDRDRYTRQAIQDEFRGDPMKEAIEFDKDQRAFLTPVSDKRFYVVWYWEEAGLPSKSRPAAEPTAVVRAVLPLTNVTKDTTQLKEYVQRAVERESKGQIVV